MTNAIALLHSVCLAALAPMPLSVPEVPPQQATVTYQLVTDEIKAKQADGTAAEVYRFDPGTIVVMQGTPVDLNIRGFKGHDHPVVLEGYNVRGVVHRNQVTTLHFTADKPGVFRLICTSHADAAHEGPMEAYIVVVPGKG